MINLVKVANREEGQVKAHDLLKKLVDGKTLLALSGGTSMDYSIVLGIANKSRGVGVLHTGGANDVIAGAICVVDERYGKPFHKDSNEFLLKNFGVEDFANKHVISLHKFLNGKDFLQTAKVYDAEIQDLFGRFDKKVGVMGVGANLHTAGIFPYSVAAKSPSYVEAEEIDADFPKRLTLTLKALGEFTSFVILMFGSAKRNTIKIMLDEDENDMQKYPAIFYRKAPIKSYLITDQVLN